MSTTPATYDILIRDATLVDAQGERRGDLAIADGKIAALGPQIDGSVRQTIEAANYFVLPGYIDAHVHLNEPGREHWEGFITGSAALAAGGCTCFVDMPLNSTPVLDAASFAAKAARLEKHSRLDGALWGGLVPGNLDRMKELAGCGVIGFKAFMSNSGMDDFPRSDHVTLREGMARAADLKLPVAVHAEDDEMTSRLAREAQASGASGIRDYLDSRPIEAELEAISVAVDLSRQTGCSLHVVHVSSAQGLQMIAEAAKAGVDVTAETCPHYLLLDEDDVSRLGAVAKCAPPLRSGPDKEFLWQALQDGLVNTIGSDHSPSPPELKTSANFFEVWGGIAGAQHNYPLFFEEALRRKCAPSFIARLTALNVAKRFRLPKKGDLRVGWDADLVLINPNSPHEIKAADLLTRHPLSAYVGRSTRVRVAMTIAGGQIVYNHNQPTQHRSARILRPQSQI
jgi:allantoinase